LNGITYNSVSLTPPLIAEILKAGLRFPTAARLTL
jgi:hypothetical protein